MRGTMFLTISAWVMLAGCGDPVNPADSDDSSRAVRIAPDDEPVRPQFQETLSAPLPEDAANGSSSADPAARPPVYWGVAEGEALPLIWEDLMPLGGSEALEAEYREFYEMLSRTYGEGRQDTLILDGIEEGSDLDYMPQLGSFETVDELEGLLVRIPGYVVPLDFDLRKGQSAFLFAPYMGACIHTPPPPPNQLIYVEADPPVQISDIYTAFWIEGVLASSRQDTDLASAAYVLRLDEISLYEAR